MIGEPQTWRARDALIAVVAGLGASALAAAALSGGGITVLEIFAVILPAQSITSIGCVAYMTRSRGLPEFSGRPRVLDLVGIPIGAGIQLVLAALALSIVEAFFDGEVPGQEVIDVAGETSGGAERVLAFAGLVILGPIAEEVIFRGILLPALLHRGRRRAVVLSSLAFALLHLIDPQAAFSVPFLFVLGIVLANETLRTGGLSRAIAIHAGFNLVTVIAIFVAT